MGADPRLRPDYRAQAEALVAEWLEESTRRGLAPLEAHAVLVFRIECHTTRCAAEAAAREREACCEAVCSSCRGDVLSHVMHPQRNQFGEWRHEWKDEYGHGSTLCRAVAIRRRGEPEGGND